MVGDDLIGLVTLEEELQDLLKVNTETIEKVYWRLMNGIWIAMVTQLEDVIDLVIPRGKRNLVSQIKQSTNIPVLGLAGMTNHIVNP